MKCSLSSTSKTLGLAAALLWSVDGMAAYPYTFAEGFSNSDSFMRFRLLGALEIPATYVDEILVTELSGLVWDEDEQRLYALSDQGSVFHLSPVFDGELLVDVTIEAGFRLRDAAGAPLRGRDADAEGLDALNQRNAHPGDTELLIAFERNARIASYTPAGRLIKPYPVSSTLMSDCSGSNRGFESVASGPPYGIITACEMPKNRDRPSTDIYSTGGQRWEFERFPAPNSALVGMELLPDERLLTLERSYSSIWQPLLIVLRLSKLQPDGSFETRPVVTFNSYDGWRLDNFEGLTRHLGQKFFMVSDDNENALQRTLLVYFEILSDSVGSVPPTNEN